MPIFVCTLLGCLVAIISYSVIWFLRINQEDKDIGGLVVSSIVFGLLSVAIGIIIHYASKDYTQIILEDYHRNKIETVITTIQSDGNLIKQDTTYRYKWHLFS